MDQPLISNAFSFVYILHHVNDDRVKIGKADNVLRRAFELNSSQFDFSKSFAFAVRTSEIAHTLERGLHRFLFNHRLKPQEHGLVKEDGYTEWFSTACLPVLSSLMNVVITEFDATIFSSDDLIAALKEKIVVHQAAILKGKIERQNFYIEQNNAKWAYTRSLRLENPIGYQKYVIKKYMPRRNFFYQNFIRGIYSRPSSCDTSPKLAEHWNEASAFLDKVRNGTLWGEMPLESPFNRKYIASSSPKPTRTMQLLYEHLEQLKSVDKMSTA